MNTRPDARQSLDLLVSQALAHLSEGRVQAAEGSVRQALAASATDVHALAVLGLTLHLQGRHMEAVAVFRELTRLEPLDPGHWMNLGTSLRQDHKLDESLAAMSRAGQLGADSADFFFNVGLLHIERQDFEAAIALLRDALALAPEDAATRQQLAYALHQRLRDPEALDVLAQWQTRTGLTPEVVAGIGHLLMNLGDMQGAGDALARVQAHDRPTPAALLKLVEIEERLNRLPQARLRLDRLRADPASRSLGTDLDTTEALLAQREERHAEAVALLTRLAAETHEAHLQHFHYFKLAKSLDALGRYEEAFRALEQAHVSQALHMRMKSPEVALLGATPMHITRHGVDRLDVARWDQGNAPDVDASPIFIVAFPRSGTTLLELTLDAHPDLVSMDEQPFLHKTLDHIASLGLRYPAELAQLSQQQLADIRAGYFARVRAKVELKPGQRLVDKNPLNLLRLPAIKRLFPHAPIVLAVRHPCDVIMSCFMQQFGAPEFALLCVDLPTLASGYRRAFDFWYEQSALLAPACQELRYERFVTDFDSEIRKLADFLRLPWNDRLLAPAQHAQGKGFISTPSYSQVVQPVNSRSVGRWQRYRPHFDAALDIVRPYLQRWDYAG